MTRGNRTRNVKIFFPAEIVYSMSAEERVDYTLEVLQNCDVGIVGKDRAKRILMAAVEADRNTAKARIS